MVYNGVKSSVNGGDRMFDSAQSGFCTNNKYMFPGLCNNDDIILGTLIIFLTSPHLLLYIFFRSNPENYELNTQEKFLINIKVIRSPRHYIVCISNWIILNLETLLRTTFTALERLTNI